MDGNHGPGAAVQHFPVQRDPNLASPGTVLDGVVQQVVQEALQTQRIPLPNELLLLGNDHQTMPIAGHAVFQTGPTDQRDQVDWT